MWYTARRKLALLTMAKLLQDEEGILLRRSVDCVQVVVPTEITYMDKEDEYKYMVSKIHIFKVHTFKINILYLRITKIHIFKLHILYLEITKIHIFKSIFEFPISSLGLPNFSLKKTEKEHRLNILPRIKHQPDRIVT